MDYREFLRKHFSWFMQDISLEYWSLHPGSQPDNRDGVTIRYSHDHAGGHLYLEASCGIYPTRQMNEIAAAVLLIEKDNNRVFQGANQQTVSHTLSVKTAPGEPGVSKYV